MNPNYNQTITIYNCLKGEDNPTMKDIWQRTVLHNCFYKNAIGQIESGNSLRMSSAYTVRIPPSDQFLAYADWKQLEEADRKAHFTCRVGDLIILGECGDEITGISPNTASQILKKHKPDAFRVSVFSDNTKYPYGKHYRAGGGHEDNV